MRPSTHALTYYSFLCMALKQEPLGQSPFVGAKSMAIGVAIKIAPLFTFCKCYKLDIFRTTIRVHNISLIQLAT